MRLWRIASGRHPPLDGEGARRLGGRWNTPGRPVVYTATTASLAVLEVLVWTDPDTVPADLRLFEIDLPDRHRPERLDPAVLPAGWTEPGFPACAAAGDRWLASGRTVALAVPSAVLPEESNVLLNPIHPAMGNVRLVSERPFTFDLRLLR